MVFDISNLNAASIMFKKDTAEAHESVERGTQFSSRAALCAPQLLDVSLLAKEKRESETPQKRPRLGRAYRSTIYLTQVGRCLSRF